MKRPDYEGLIADARAEARALRESAARVRRSMHGPGADAVARRKDKAADRLDEQARDLERDRDGYDSSLRAAANEQLPRPLNTIARLFHA